MLPNNDDELISRLALTFIDGIGPKLGRILLSHFGSAKEILQASPRELKHAGGMGEVRAKAIRNPEARKRAEEEYAFVLKHNIQTFFLTDEAYPARLKSCDDAPLLLYYRGTASLNAQKVIAVIGTRKNTDYGLRATEELIGGLQGIGDVIVISGLAYGIDAIAHKSCLKAGIPTIGVVGHGMDKMYPAVHRTLARDMIQAGGGVLTEFPSGTNPDRTNFPVRNRIVAGLSDVTVIVESDEKGGAMITAYVAASYGREVAAFPGRVYDSRSGGPNKLIRMNIASLITGTNDLLDMMNWDGTAKAVQKEMFYDLSPEEQAIIRLLQDKDGMHADDLAIQGGLNNSQLAAVLLQLEMQDIIKALPGKVYRMN